MTKDATGAYTHSAAKWMPCIEKAVDEALTFPDSVSETLVSAMRYSVLLPGKRIRPLLVLLACQACGGDPEKAVPAATAIEMVHAFSLIHDDLPAMDNDDLRRGHPTNHKVYGEAEAILAGDALLARAFQVLATLDSPAALPCIRLLAKASGPEGMTGGQSIDMRGLPADAVIEDVRRLHEAKTGALIVCATQMGAVIAGADQLKEKALVTYAGHLGLLFQVTDDLLDVSGDQVIAGKALGKDAAAGKKTYPMLLGIEKCRQWTIELAEKAVANLSIFGDEAEPLRSLAIAVRDRQR